MDIKKRDFLTGSALIGAGLAAGMRYAGRDLRLGRNGGGTRHGGDAGGAEQKIAFLDVHEHSPFLTGRSGSRLTPLDDSC